jgi:hypothetical protein
MTETLTTLCLDHLRNEQVMIKTALSIVGAIQSAFSVRGPDAFSEALGRHRELTAMFADIQHCRRQFAEAVSRLVRVPPEKITMPIVLPHLSETDQARITDATARARDLAQELTAANFVASVHIRVHLDAYRRILRDLTNTNIGSGRYCPAGNAESLEYRPMMQITG